MAHPDIDALLNEGLQIAIHLLEKNGEFFPFGVVMSPTGEIVHIQGAIEDEIPPSQEIINLLTNAFISSARSGEYKAIALVSNVCFSHGTIVESDAISVMIEHEDAEPVNCFLPYSKNSGSFEFGDLVAEQGERQVFGF